MNFHYIVKSIIIWTLRINAKCPYGIRRVRFPNRTLFIQSIDAVRKPHLPGSAHIFLDFTIITQVAT